MFQYNIYTLCKQVLLNNFEISINEHKMKHLKA